jgi:hypothetical protein
VNRGVYYDRRSGAVQDLLPRGLRELADAVGLPRLIPKRYEKHGPATYAIVEGKCGLCAERIKTNGYRKDLRGLEESSATILVRNLHYRCSNEEREAGAPATGTTHDNVPLGLPPQIWIPKLDPDGDWEPYADKVAAILSEVSVRRDTNKGPHEHPILGCAASYGLAGDIVRAIEPHSEADPVAILVQLLVGFGNLIFRRARFAVEADEHYTNLNAVLVGQSSKARKGTSWGHVRRLLAGVDPTWAQERVMSGMSSGEGLIWQVRDEVEKTNPETGESIVVVDGVQDKRLLVTETEFASVLKVIERQGNTLSPLIRQAWDTGDLQILTKHSPAQATGAHISIIAHITNDELLRRLAETEAANGFGNRFLWFAVRRSKYLPDGGQLKSEDLSSLIARLRTSFEFVIDMDFIGKLEREPAARALWHDVYPELSEGLPGLVGALTSRAEAQTMRLACIYAVLDCSDVIRREHLEAALALWAYSEASCAFIFGDALGNPIADRILAALHSETDGLTRTKIFELFGRHVRAGEIDLALDFLAQAGLVSSETVQTGGRPSQKWRAIAKEAKEAKEVDAHEGFALLE